METHVKTAADGPPARTGTPRTWRLALAVVVLALAATAYLAADVLGPRGQSALGVVCFLGVAGVVSADLRAINWRTVGWGIALQVSLALFVLKFEVAGHRPGKEFFEAAAGVAKKFLAFSDEGGKFVFGKLAEPGEMDKVFGPGNGFVFAFRALPTIIFVSSFFTVLYYFGILQWVVRAMAWAMRFLMRTSGAETLSVTANVVMGQTEAPLMVKPYVERMTQSELLALMVGGMAHISGALMAVYIGMGADAVAILATSVMASPCSLYLAKIVLPETGQPETGGVVKTVVEKQHANVIDAAASGASDGVRLAINIAAMLIAFLAFIALFNYGLGLLADQANPRLADLSGWLNPRFGWQLRLEMPRSLDQVFGWLFAPLAYLLGLNGPDVPMVADLLGRKLVLNEFVAYTQLSAYKPDLSERGLVLSTYALTGFANFASIGIQLGGIGAMAPSRRADLARLGGWALLTGFLVTLVNAAIAGVLL
jgi:CNT family concentrative nucleoside transporter